MAQVLHRAVRERCEQIALEARSAMGQSAMDRLDPQALAGRLGIETLSLEAFRKAHPEAVEQLVEVNPNAFSGALVPFENRQVILFNPAHPPDRHRHTICHELAHVLLKHKPEPPFDRNLKRRFNPLNEAEADYLAEALLVPLTAAAPVAGRFGNDICRAARHFGVSRQSMHARLLESRSRSAGEFRPGRRLSKFPDETD